MRIVRTDNLRGACVEAHYQESVLTKDKVARPDVARERLDNFHDMGPRHYGSGVLMRHLKFHRMWGGPGGT
eukprot:4213941-Amphidinium_carterae.3